MMAAKKQPSLRSKLEQFIEQTQKQKAFSPAEESYLQELAKAVADGRLKIVDLKRFLESNQGLFPNHKDYLVIDRIRRIARG